MGRDFENSLPEWNRKVREVVGRWEGAFGLDPDPLFFEGFETMPDFQYEPGEFSFETAWWLGELCRLAYTPDKKEAPRKKNRGLPSRDLILEERTPFEELLSIHKTGNHASIYRRKDETGPTILCFRGTSRTRQWIMNSVVRPHRWRRFRVDGDSEEAFVHSGFYVFLKRVLPLLESEMKALPRPWIVTGHSLGGALSMLTGPLLEPDLICTFGAPKVGNETFYQLRTGRDLWRFVNDDDLVPRLPLEDQRLGDRQFRHGLLPLWLGRETGAFQDSVDEVSHELPLLLKESARDLSRPPGWIVDHRIGEYCRKIRDIVSGCLPD